MKKEYDFSEGVRGKFYRKNIRINTPTDPANEANESGYKADKAHLRGKDIKRGKI